MSNSDSNSNITLINFKYFLNVSKIITIIISLILIIICCYNIIKLRNRNKPQNI